jgi:hypothetical protein
VTQTDYSQAPQLHGTQAPELQELDLKLVVERLSFVEMVMQTGKERFQLQSLVQDLVMGRLLA